MPNEFAWAAILVLSVADPANPPPVKTVNQSVQIFWGGDDEGECKRLLLPGLQRAAEGTRFKVESARCAYVPAGWLKPFVEAK